MKYLKITFIVFGMCLWMADASAQTRKKLREEIAELESVNTQLRNENRKLNYEKQKLQEEKKHSSELSDFYEEEVARLRKDSARLQQQIAQIKAEKATAVKAAKEEATATYRPDPNDTRPCAHKQGTLETGYSYFPKTLNRLNTKGWGVQVFSFSTLCQAMEKAEEFSAQYQMWKTYIRVRDKDGRRTYSVVYGSLRDEGQARTYTENFKKVAQGPEGRNAFLVQH